MKEINTENWQEFQIGKLFQVSRGRRFVVGKHKEGNIPYYSASLENNGITDYISNPLFIDKNAIIVTTFCDAFYAKGEFTASDEITILHHEKMNEINGLFIASAIRKNAWKYSFKVKAFQTRIIEDTIKLPINKKGELDWEYMESYMKNIMQESERDIENLKNICNKKKEIELNNWKSFTIGKLFENIVKPPVLHTKNVTENINGIPYVVRTKFNNGIKYNVEKTLQMQPSPAGTISFGAENATFFYQEREYVSGRDIYYIDTRHLTKYACLFVVTSLQTIAEKYSYNYGMFPELVKKEEIKLPVNKKGEPDWDYMENYMKNIMQNTQSKLDKLVCC